jgi:hypothetical protein
MRKKEHSILIELISTCRSVAEVCNETEDWSASRGNVRRDLPNGELIEDDQAMRSATKEQKSGSSLADEENRTKRGISGRRSTVLRYATKDGRILFIHCKGLQRLAVSNDECPEVEVEEGDRAQRCATHGSSYVLDCKRPLGRSTTVRSYTQYSSIV